MLLGIKTNINDSLPFKHSSFKKNTDFFILNYLIKNDNATFSSKNYQTGIKWKVKVPFPNTTILNFKYLFLFIYLAAQGLSCGMWDLVPQPGIKPRAQHWELTVLATGPPGESLFWILIGISKMPSKRFVLIYIPIFLKYKQIYLIILYSLAQTLSIFTGY